MNEEITIMRVANGWLVRFPMRFNVSPVPDYTDPETIKKMAKLMRGEMQKDETLEEIESKNREETVKKAARQSFMPPAMENMFIFSTWEEVIECLGVLK